ncbi:PepSY-associated TM region [Dyadobacter koreensis]|uniref:PepSY-associated TM region n=1 Tax=Dyadobacter koreensis TaxID=408657 RepID=A0A1H6QCB5_9BACT|nr:PepSY-associated TM helix domain-containing protein [Dyadobacter koreensis]SEI38484.1 PepSY-associated TM region [Dyadobacter koreensis]
MSAKKINSFLHLCLGLLSGLMVIILSITGCIYRFKDQIQNIVSPGSLFVTPENMARIPVSRLIAGLYTQISAGYPLTIFEIWNDSAASYRICIYKIIEYVDSNFPQCQ